jgi:hypothetical protein
VGRHISTAVLELTRTLLQDLYRLSDLQRKAVAPVSPPVVHGCKKKTLA